MGLLIILEGVATCFALLLPCVVGIANGPVNMVFLYEREVQERVVSLGLITEEKIAENAKRFKIFGIIPFMALVIFSVYAVNGARGFRDGFFQITAILLIEGLFDRLFVDWYWVGKTKAWIIEGTEDLMPYIYGKTLMIKWASVLAGYPLMAALISFIMSLILK